MAYKTVSALIHRTVAMAVKIAEMQRRPSEKCLQRIRARLLARGLESRVRTVFGGALRRPGFRSNAPAI